MPESVLVRKVHDEMVLLDMASEQYFGLDEVGTFVLEAVNAGATVDAAVAAVAETFDGPEEQIRADVVALIDDLVSTGLLMVSPP
jgi:hypothetical protein